MFQPITTAESIIQYDYYISGPMTGIKAYNFPAFNAEAQTLRDEGYDVFNPAESFSGDISRSYQDYLRMDTLALARSKGIVLLDGWRRSRGACYEYLIAKSLNLEILNREFSDRDDKNIGDVHRVALLGYARTGKDTVGSVLVKEGYKRVAIGDIIKSQLDPVIQAHLGHSAFTENDELKENIREALVHFGYANYENILAEFMEFIPRKAVNTRLFRFEEALAWAKLEGADVWLLNRPGHGPEEPKVKEELDKIVKADLVDKRILNNSCLTELEQKVNYCISA